MNAGLKFSDRNADAMAHILGAHACFHGAMAALINHDARAALIEMDKVIAISTEARRILAGQTAAGEK